MMQAIIQKNYGNFSSLQLEEVARPIPKSDELLIRVRVSSINKADLYGVLGLST